MRSPFELSLALLAAAAITGCGPQAGPTTAAASSPDASPSGSTTGSVIDGSFEVEGDRSLYLECRGDSEGPTILFLHGYGGNRTHGYHLFDGYAEDHLVCVYDRANMGGSDQVEGTQTGADLIADLTSLLAAAEVPPPYLLVAGSHGGLIAELFAADQPEAVVGMVLIDASLHSDADVDRYFAEIGELDLEQFEAEYASQVEATLWTIHDEARAALEHIPDVPITYLRALRASDLPPEAQEIWDAGLAELLSRSSNGQKIDVDGPHDLPAPVVHDAVDQMLHLLRKGGA